MHLVGVFGRDVGGVEVLPGVNWRRRERYISRVSSDSKFSSGDASVESHRDM